MTHHSDLSPLPLSSRLASVSAEANNTIHPEDSLPVETVESAHSPLMPRQAWASPLKHLKAVIKAKQALDQQENRSFSSTDLHHS